ncbi:UDP-N-acetylmuramoyl-tripeptide--D-alanyl-D-alanine ligase [Virgibacillus halophilus]|uniref:UDP-N-acetylmuramoyl-tripeptide--D-alanyl-D-alanine ligase n=1 Tax=Tigheibacillus halophilus TaxID=361280 RepID=A0ABU5CAE2_9BACI|nr:UDP-N-acetylmuramoyl-tripeptide--D-alanyl-D-alanine ligase [Virgibacillus halophilus]
MLFNTDWLMRLFEDFTGMPENDVSVHSVETDSRKAAEKSLFVPLVGEKFDGHDYIKQAFDNGAIATFWKKGKPLPNFLPADFPVFFVEDTLLAMQQLAKAYRDKVDPVVIGITGSNGKTTTKDLVSAVVWQKYNTHFTNGNFNNHIGLPLTILSMDPKTEVLVLEMGMNHSGEIATLTKIAEPDYGIITNIGEAHIEYLGSREGIARAKLEILQGLKHDGIFIFNGDEPLLQMQTYAQETITCGFHEDNDIVIHDVSVEAQQTVFRLGADETYRIPLLGEHHCQNAAYAITVGKKLGLQHHEIQRAFDEMKLTGMRFEMLKGKNGSIIINDAYNASPSSMRASIEVVKQLKPYAVKVLVLGDMFELGSDAEQWHRQMADSITEPISAVLTYGHDAQYIASAMNSGQTGITCEHFASKEELLKNLQTYLRPEALILFKASRGMNFETMVNEVLEVTNLTE